MTNQLRRYVVVLTLPPHHPQAGTGTSEKRLSPQRCVVTWTLAGRNRGGCRALAAGAVDAPAFDDHAPGAYDDAGRCRPFVIFQIARWPPPGCGVSAGELLTATAAAGEPGWSAVLLRA